MSAMIAYARMGVAILGACLIVQAAARAQTRGHTRHLCPGGRIRIAVAGLLPLKDVL